MNSALLTAAGTTGCAFAYAFVRGGKLCTVSYLTVRDSTEFRAAIDALTLDGRPIPEVRVMEIIDL